MRTTLSLILACMVCVASVAAADNAKEIEAVLRSHADATLNAEQVRVRVVQRSRDNAIDQLVKLAKRAYSAKDRVSETHAWKAVLGINREHAQAVQYFKDLGTLDQVLKELPDVETALTAKQFKVAGNWDVLYNNGKRITLTISPDGWAQFEENGKIIRSKITADGDSMIIHWDQIPCLNRLTIVGDKLLCEQWCPASTFPKLPHSSGFGFAVRGK